MKIILFGSTGMLGNYIFKILSNKFNVIKFDRNKFDIINDDFNSLNELLKLNENDIIINCAGLIPHTKNNNIREYILVNTLFPHKLNELCNLNKAKLIHISTDCVFSGLSGNYSNLDKHDSTNIYGISKSLGEPNTAMIIRTSIIGEEIRNKQSLIEWVLSMKNKTINGYVNHKWNGVTCLTLSNLILSLIETKNLWFGVKHVCSEEVISKYDLCCYINTIYDTNITIVKYNDDTPKDMTLKGDIIIHDTIFNQILEQKNLFTYNK